MTMGLRGCRCAGVVPQSMLGGLLPLRSSQSALRLPISIGRGRQNRRGCLAVKARGSRDDYEFGAGGENIVDADMIVLRKRIYELKRQESDYESPEEWMEWEKRWHGKYLSGVFQAVECLQYNLMNSRPSVGIAVLSLICVSVPASVVGVLVTCASHLTAWIADGRGS